jgi:hypothetical protein
MDLMGYADNLDLKFILQIKLLIKKAKILSLLKKFIIESAECLYEA